MKVLMVHPHDLFSPMEPWTIRIMKLADELANKGHEIIIMYFPMGKCGESRYRDIRLIPCDRTISARSLMRNTALLYKFSLWADMVHFQKSHFYAAIPTLCAAYLAGKPAHYDWDDWEERIFYSSVQRKTPSTVLTGLSFKLLEHWLPFLADSVTVSSEALRTLAMRCGVSAAKVFVAPVGADLKLFNTGLAASAIREKYNIKDEVLIFYHGQLHGCQYVRMLFKAIRIIYEARADGGLKFMVVGSGSELGPLKEFARELGIGHKLIFTDFVAHVDVPQYIAAADICVAPFEDNEVARCKSPLKIVEYLASGKPIVGSDVGEVRAMLEGVGVLVQPGNPQELVRGILGLVHNKELRRTMSLAARQRAEEKYNWSSSAESLEKAYMMGMGGH